MKNFKKFLSIVLIVSMLLVSLAACKPNGTVNENDDDPETPPIPTGIDISGYKIVRSENASSKITKFTTAFQKEMLRYTGVDMPVADDYLEDGESADGVKEILIGKTVREESASAESALQKAPDSGYVIRAYEDKIVILGKTEDATVRAMKYFLMTYAASSEVDNYITLEVGKSDSGKVNLNSLVFDNFTEIYTEFKSNIAISGRDFPKADTGYETLIQLNHNGENNGTLFASFANYGDDGYAIYKSTDNGKSWSYLSTARDTYNTGSGSDSSNPTKHTGTAYKLQPCLYELPCDMGDFKEGTLFLGACTNGQGFYKGKVGATTSMTLYYSKDLGVTWTAYVNVDLAGNDLDDTGVWEPFFIFDESTKRVYCYYSDESDEAGTKPGKSAQKLVYKYSTDMKTWVGKDGKTAVTADPFEAISGNEPYYRPGMASVAKMGNGKYFMAYELCVYTPDGKNNGCPAYYAISDSIDWENINGFGDYGKPLVTVDGYQFGSSPWCAWTPAGGECGTLVIVGHHNSKGEPITRDENNVKYGTDMILSFDYGETFIRIKNPIPYYLNVFSKSAYSPYVGFSADGNTLFYVNNPPDDTTKAYQKIVFASIKIW